MKTVKQKRINWYFVALITLSIWINSIYSDYKYGFIFISLFPLTYISTWLIDEYPFRHCETYNLKLKNAVYKTIGLTIFSYTVHIIFNL